MSIDVRPPGGLDAASALPDPTKAIAAPWFPPVTLQIAAVAERMPDAVAIEDPQGTITYAELWRAGERLALRLQRAGVESDDRVAIAGVRSSEFVIAMIAVLRAGAVAVPIDASLPPIRRSAMLEESGGPRVKVLRVAVIDCAVLGATDGRLRARVVWASAGDVSHWGHTHRRRNQYRGELLIEAEEGRWKVRDVKILSEERT